MINFRFHLVSLTAIFLALAAGITIGAGVVDRATVNQIENQLHTVERNRKATLADNAKLSTDLARWGQFSEQAGDRMVRGRIDGESILMVAVRGFDRGVAEGLRTTLSAGGARVQGTVWFTNKWNLAGQDDARQLAGILDAAPTTRPEDLRTAALTRLAAAWGTGDGGSFAVALQDAGFLEFEALPGTTTTSLPLAQLPLPNSRFVVLSGDDADVASPLLALPLVDRLASAGARVLAGQPVRHELTKDEAAKLPPEFIPALLTENQTAPKVATVDNVDDYRGRVAAVFALKELGQGRAGHYGFADGARLLPEEAP